MSRKQILAQALRLTGRDRRRLAHDLWESVTDPPNRFATAKAEAAELDRRLDDLDRNPDLGIPWQDALRQLQRRFGQAASRSARSRSSTSQASARRTKRSA